MKLATSSEGVESGNLGKTTGFKIQANAKAFRALSSTLYKEQVWSLLRELACNGQDAHVEAGHTQPITIKLPNPLNPDFYVQDSGKGLSPEGITDLYTTYFSSSKDQSNDQVGAFGLGSKSPFAYTDQFTVVSAHQGIETTYLAYLEGGEPAISTVAERPVDPAWPSGLRVGFPVAPKDFSQFEQEARRLNWMDPLPVFEGADLQLQKPERLWKFGYLAGYSRKDMPLQTPSQLLVMGGIAYPLELSLAKYRGSAYDTIVVLEAPIGSVEVSLSRESLSLTQYTEAGIDRLVQESLIEIGDKANQLFSSYPSYREAFEEAGTELSAALACLEKDSLARRGLRLNNLLGLEGDLQALSEFSRIPMEFFYPKTYSTDHTNFRMEAQISDAARNFLQKPNPLFARVPSERSGDENWIRDRIRTLVRPVYDQKGVGLVVLHDDRAGAPVDWGALEKRLGWPIVDLAQIKPLKTGGADQKSATRLVKGLEYVAKDLGEKPVTRTSYYWRTTFEPGSIALEAGQTVFAVLGWKNSKHACSNRVNFRGLNPVLEALGLPKADTLMMFYSEKEFKKALGMGCLDLGGVLKEFLQYGDPALAFLDFMVKPAHERPDRGLSALLFEWFSFPEVRTVLASTEAGQLLESAYTPKVSSWLPIALRIRNWARELHIPEPSRSAPLGIEERRFIEALGRLTPLDPALQAVNFRSPHQGEVAASTLELIRLLTNGLPPARVLSKAS